jgi:type II secretory pathway pseudopilin PulG
MVMWPAVSLLGFVVLTALVVLMGMQSTKRYEAEKQAASAVRQATDSAARATAAATAVL